MSKNYGLNFAKEQQEQSEEDYFGGIFALPDIASIPEEDRIKYLPKGEVQRGAEDVMDCVSRRVNNHLETKFNYLIRNNLLPKDLIEWFIENNYIIFYGNEPEFESSDAWLAIKSNTTRAGNSLKAPTHAAHDWGLIPKSLMPLESWMTFENYHDPKRITLKIESLAKEFRKKIKINYEKVNDFQKGLINDMFGTGLYAWPTPINGVYPRVEYPPNHDILFWKRSFFVFDNYTDNILGELRHGNFIKQLAPDYITLKYGYRMTINLEKVKQTFSLWRLIKSWLLSIRRYLGL